MVISISASRGQFLHLGKTKEATADFLNTLKRANSGILAFCTSEPPGKLQRAGQGETRAAAHTEGWQWHRAGCRLCAPRDSIYCTGHCSSSSAGISLGSESGILQTGDCTTPWPGSGRVPRSFLTQNFGLEQSTAHTLAAIKSKAGSLPSRECFPAKLCSS